MRCRLQCPESIGGQDIDDLFAYSTTKTVKIRDHRLGCIYVAALFFVFIYIGVYSLAYCLNYLNFNIPTGTVRFSLQQPTLNNCDPSDSSCLDNFPNKSSLPYCCREGCDPSPPASTGAGCTCPFRHFRNYDCAFVDGDSASITQRFGIFITTRRKKEMQHVNETCLQADADSCSKLWLLDAPTAVTTKFVAAIEDFTVLIDHAAQVPATGFYKQARDLEGRLRIRGTSDREQALCKQPGAWNSHYGGSRASGAPCYIEPSHPDNNTLDFFSLSTLLTAAEVRLDERSYKGSNHSARYEGMTMLLNINWFNTQPWSGLGTPGYTYELFAMAQSSYSVHTNIWADSTQHARTLVSTHGIMLQGNIIGQIGNFDFNTLLLQLTASLTLLAVANLIVNYAATCCLKYRLYYQHAMTSVTADFSAVDEMEALPMDELRAISKRRFLPYNGSRVELINRLVMDGYSPDDAVSGIAASAISGSAVDSQLATRGSADRARAAPLLA